MIARALSPLPQPLRPKFAACSRLPLASFRPPYTTVWLGVATGSFLSVLLGSVGIGLFYHLRKNLFDDDAEQEKFEGAVGLFAAALLTFLAFSMSRVLAWYMKWEGRLLGAIGASDALSNRSSRWSIYFLVVSSILREGLESVLFIAGIGASQEAESIPIPALLGLIVAIAVGVLMFRGGRCDRSHARSPQMTATTALDRTQPLMAVSVSPLAPPLPILSPPRSLHLHSGALAHALALAHPLAASLGVRALAPHPRPHGVQEAEPRLVFCGQLAAALPAWGRHHNQLVPRAAGGARVW